MKIALTAGSLALVAMMGNAYAETATCPSISTISQQALPSGGYSYAAPGPNGQTWAGENPQAESSYLADSTFTDAQYKDETKAVICSYEGAGNAGVRVTLKPVKSRAAASGTNWSGVECKASDISKCSFTYSN